ncbi:MAG: tRNA lysidine(34) synthetase TilS [Kiritimatiellia bacterium]
MFGPFRLEPDAPAFHIRFTPGPLIREPRNLSPSAFPKRCTINAALAGQTVVLRPPQPGDRISPAGSGITLKISDILTNHKVPRAQRAHVPILALQDGTVLWLPGYAVAEAAAVRGNANGVQVELKFEI